mmetsp:Transcript_20612/g.27812  ORF Transcript_20612/g.27812 Transcript_20612/m.27812 type:complete len:231 (+) Transcript_20612:1-693(+)
MGCGGAKFTEEEGIFFQKQHAGDGQYLCSKVVNATGFVKMSLKRDMYRSPEDYTVKSADGSSLLQIVNDVGRKKVLAMDGTLICLTTFAVRYSAVNAIDASFNLPHIYVYSLFPYRDGQAETGVDEDNTKLYLWARIHRVTNVGIPKFEIAMAEYLGSASGENIEMFGYTAYTATRYPDSRMEVFKGGAGCCQVNLAGNDSYAITVAPLIDPILMVSSIMAMESLKGKTT